MRRHDAIHGYPAQPPRTPDLPPPTAFAGESPPASVVAKLQAGEAVEALVDFDTLEIDGEALAMANAQGRRVLRGNELAYKRAALAVLKQSALAGIEEVSVLREYPNLSSSYLRFETEEALTTFLQRPQVLRVHAAYTVVPLVAESLPLIEQPAVEAAGLVGAGKTIVVLDTGVDYTQAFFGCSEPGEPGCRVVATFEAPGGDDGSPDSHPKRHGTLVSAIAASVAPGANLAVADVYSPGDIVDDVVAAIEWTIDELVPIHDVVVMNMSFRIVPSTADVWNPEPCPTAPPASALSDMALVGVQPISASGNSALNNGTSRTAP
jgi:hypothetical protein